METTLSFAPVTIFVGNYGSGKTEVAVNLAQNRKNAGINVQIADLDVVNPYFRTREVRTILESKGIHVVLPEESLLNADLPVVVPQIRGLIKNPKGMAILDAGGDDTGATVLGSLIDILYSSPHDMLQVVNANRPFTDTTEGCLRIAHEIEYASKLKITGIVGNTHLMDDTSLESILTGLRLSLNVSKKLGVPLKFITCPESLLGELDTSEVPCPVLPITRQLLPPWRLRQKTGSQNFLLS